MLVLGQTESWKATCWSWPSRIMCSGISLATSKHFFYLHLLVVDLSFEMLGRFKTTRSKFCLYQRSAKTGFVGEVDRSLFSRTHGTNAGIFFLSWMVRVYRYIVLQSQTKRFGCFRWYIYTFWVSFSYGLKTNQPEKESNISGVYIGKWIVRSLSIASAFCWWILATGHSALVRWQHVAGLFLVDLFMKIDWSSKRQHTLTNIHELYNWPAGRMRCHWRLHSSSWAGSTKGCWNFRVVEW